MLVVTNCTKHYATPIYQSLLQNAGDATRHDSLLKLPYSISQHTRLIPYMHYPAQAKTLYSYAAYVLNYSI